MAIMSKWTLSDLRNIEQAHVVLHLNYVGDNVLGIGYKTPSSNRPATYGNTLSLWEDSNNIPWTKDPTAVQPIDEDCNNSSVLFAPESALTTTAYIVGYSLSPEKKDLCSLLKLKPTGNPGEPYSPIPSYTTLSLKNVGPDGRSFLVQYSTLPGHEPSTNGAWIGLWDGNQLPYESAGSLLAYHPVRRDSGHGVVPFNDVALGIGRSYTLAYFTSGWSQDRSALQTTALAATLGFQGPA